MSFEKGYIPWNKGKRYKSPGISNALKGKTPKNFIEFRKKGSLACIGRKPWNRGIKGVTKGINLGEKNGWWVGDNIKYIGLHVWVRRRLTEPNLCPSCGENKKLDLCSINGKYKRNLKNWEYLCRKCHMIKDGRIKGWRKYSKML